MDRNKLIFVVEGSIRYHRARADHFLFRSRWLTIASAFLGGSVVAGVIASSTAVTTAAGLLVAAINAYQLVAKPDQAARQHEEWCRDWSKLKGEVEGQPQPSKATLAKWIKRKNQLNGEVIEDMKAVKAQVYNEAMTTLGRKGTPYRFTRFQRWTKHILAHTHGFDDQNLASIRSDAKIILEKTTGG